MVELRIEAYFNSPVVNKQFYKQRETFNVNAYEGWDKSDEVISFCEQFKRSLFIQLKTQTIEKLSNGYARYGDSYLTSKINDSLIYFRVVCENYPTFNRTGKKLKKTISNLLYESYNSAEFFTVPYHDVYIDNIDFFDYVETSFDGCNLFAV